MRSKHESQASELSGGPQGAPLRDLDRVKAGLRFDRGSVLTAPPFGFSPELPLSRPGGPTARPALSVPPGIKGSLRRLRGLHLQLSLCRVCLRPGSDGRLAPFDDAYLMAEPAQDGSLLVVFIHPPGVNDETAAEGLLAQRLAAGLQRQGQPIWALRFAAFHCDAAAMDDGEAIFALLLDQPLHPLSRHLRLAI